MAKCRAGGDSPPSVWTRSPSEFYIKYLLTSDQHSELAELSKRLEVQGIILPERQLDYLKKLEYELCERMPDPFRPQDLRHSVSQKFLHDQQIWSMWHPDKGIVEAATAFASRNVREHMCSLIVSGFGLTQVSRLVARGLAFHISEAGVEKYKHYFWKLEILTSSEKETILRGAKAGPVVAVAYKAGPFALGRMEVLARLGHQVESPSAVVTLRDIHRGVMSTVPEYRDQPSSRRPRYLRDLAETVEIISRTESMTQGDGLGSVLEQLRQLESSRRPAIGVDSIALSSPGFRPKGLPGRRGDLEIIDAEVEDGDVGSAGARTGKDGVQGGPGR